MNLAQKSAKRKTLKGSSSILFLLVTLITLFSISFTPPNGSNISPLRIFFITVFMVKSRLLVASNSLTNGLILPSAPLGKVISRFEPTRLYISKLDVISFNCPTLSRISQSSFSCIPKISISMSLGSLFINKSRTQPPT